MTEYTAVGTVTVRAESVEAAAERAALDTEILWNVRHVATADALIEVPTAGRTLGSRVNSAGAMLALATYTSEFGLRMIDGHGIVHNAAEVLPFF